MRWICEFFLEQKTKTEDFGSVFFRNIGTASSECKLGTDGSRVAQGDGRVAIVATTYGPRHGAHAQPWGQTTVASAVTNLCSSALRIQNALPLISSNIIRSSRAPHLFKYILRAFPRSRKESILSRFIMIFFILSQTELTLSYRGRMLLVI